uniref:Olfactory receptor n=1 Tax=Lepisosteus oculatus TaxID=7918 RepID=W5NN24_LEPOC|nr:PREDICTED: olfactory receptor 51F2-like [Lepisosteus oculatus]
MTSVITTSPVLNTTFIRPNGFYIRGFYALENSNYFFIFLGVIYVATLLANASIMSIIWFAQPLHTPKYFGVFSLALVDVSYSTSLIPKSLDLFLYGNRLVEYNTCLTQMFFVHYFSAMESYALMVLAYDRFIAICFPLRCKTINSNTKMIIVIIISWVIPFIVVLTMVSFITRLSYCKSVIVNSYFCDHGPVFKISCSDYSINWFMAAFFIVSLFFLPLALILLSYVCILVSLLKIAEADGRRKAFRTCTSHLILVAVFYVPLLATYIIAWVNVYIDTDTRILNTSLSAAIPPLLNPIIYTLKTDEIMDQIKKYIRNRKMALSR